MCSVGRSVEFHVERELDALAFSLAVELVVDVAELCIPTIAGCSRLVDADFSGITVAHLNRVKLTIGCPPSVEREVGRCVVQRLKLGCKRHIAICNHLARIVGVAVAPAFEHVEFSRGCGKRNGVAIVVGSNAPNNAVVFVCIGSCIDSCISKDDVVNVATLILEVQFQCVSSGWQSNFCLTCQDGVVAPVACVRNIDDAGNVHIVFVDAYCANRIARSSLQRPIHNATFFNRNGVIHPLACD